MCDVGVLGIELMFHTATSDCRRTLRTGGAARHADVWRTCFHRIIAKPTARAATKPMLASRVVCVASTVTSMGRNGAITYGRATMRARVESIPRVNRISFRVVRIGVSGIAIATHRAARAVAARSENIVVQFGARTCIRVTARTHRAPVGRKFKYIARCTAGRTHDCRCKPYV